MRLKVLRNVGRNHDFGPGRGLPEEARSWRENQVVDAADDVGKLLLEQKLAEPTDEPVTTPEEMQRREMVALALANPGALAAQEVATKALDQHAERQRQAREQAREPQHAQHAAAESQAKAQKARQPEQK